MNEVQLRVTLGIIPEPEKNRVQIEDLKTKENIQRIINVIRMANDQKREFEGLLIRNVSDLEPVLSFN